MLNNLIDRVGNWNPQIFRELKERLTLRNLGIASTSSLLIQGLVWFYYYNQLPVVNPHIQKIQSVPPQIDGFPLNKPHIQEIFSRYCYNPLSEKYLSGRYSGDTCSVNALGEITNINWQTWYSDIFLCLSWILPLGLILGSVYLLVADLVQEEKRGTLNFIRLSPQSAKTIFIGKILGVPSLVYLAVALLIPLHIFAGVSAGGSLTLIAAWYAVIGSLWLLLSSAATLYVLLGGVQAILTVSAVAYPMGLTILAINSYTSATINQDDWLTRTSENAAWFWLPVSNSAIWFDVFGIGCCLLATYWVWQALERRYLNPTATVISKSQSYLAIASLQIWLAGFALPLIPRTVYWKEGSIVSMAIVDCMALFLLIPLLLPSKQALQDWSRYRRERVTHQGRKFWQRELVQDLISNDKSPALLAIAINISMAMVLWIPVALFTFKTSSNGIRFIAGLCLAASLMLIYATIAHLTLFLNFTNKKRNLWIAAIVAGVMLLPLVGAIILSPKHEPTGLSAIFLLFSPLAPVGILHLSGGTILATFVAQLALLTGLTRQLQRKIQMTGQSQTKQLAVN
jgi:hypothetical protein